MAELNHNRIGAATLVENLVALVLISACLSMALVLLSSLTRSNYRLNTKDWTNQLRAMSASNPGEISKWKSDHHHLFISQSHVKDSTGTSLPLRKMTRNE